MDKCTEDRFFNDIKSHSMEVKYDNGVNRHLKFTNNGSSCYRFDLITWGGYLTICGDMGTYVFSRVSGMFEFFRMDKNRCERLEDKKLIINKSYWGEKLQSIERNGGYKEFDDDEFRERVKYDYDVYAQDEPEETMKSLWQEIESQVLSYIYDGEERVYWAIADFSSDICSFDFADFFDGGRTDDYTFHYIWCLYAIVWGIQQYDLAQAEAA